MPADAWSEAIDYFRRMPHWGVEWSDGCAQSVRARTGTGPGGVDVHVVLPHPLPT